jgi:hypothetical protein
VGHVDEDAFAGAGQGGMNDGLLIASGDLGKALTATRIIEHVVPLDDVGDPIFQLCENIGTMVDTQSVARAQVLIDPYPHDVADVTAQT